MGMGGGGDGSVKIIVVCNGIGRVWFVVVWFGLWCGLWFADILYIAHNTEKSV